jgi:membrane-associated phospholipid phosphatase
MNVAANSVKDIWKTYSYWVFLISLAFFPTYPFCNWFTSQRNNTLGLYLGSELNIPFIPEFIWAYLSMYVLFLTPPFSLNVLELQALGKRLLVGSLLSSLAFLVIPSHLGFARVIPNDPFYKVIFTGLFAVDQPHNMVPSLHVVFSALISFALLDASKAWIPKFAWLGWLILIVASTLLVHQHHLLDGFTGLAVALVLHRLIKKRESMVGQVS